MFSTSETTQAQRPSSFVILAVLTIVSMPAGWWYLLYRDPIAMALVSLISVEEQAHAIVDAFVTYPFVYASWFLFLGCILATAYFLRRRKPAWYAVITLHVAIISLSIDFAILYNFEYSSVWASMMISFAALYFAFRKDVRTYVMLNSDPR